MEAKLKVKVDVEQAVGAIDGMQDLIEAAKTFCTRVESGEVRSVNSYRAFKTALSKLADATVDEVEVKVLSPNDPGFYRGEDNQPQPPDIEEELGQLLLMVDESLDFIHHGPRIQVTDPDAVAKQYNKYVTNVIPRVKATIAARVAVKYPLTDLVDMTYGYRNGYTKEVHNDQRYRHLFDGHNKLSTSGRDILQNASALIGLTKLSKQQPDAARIMLALAKLLIDMQQIMRLFGWSMDDVRLAAREVLSRYER